MPDYPIGYEPVSTVALLTNPRSGGGSARHASEIATERLARRGVQAVAFTAMTPEDNRKVILQAMEDAAFDAIVVVGGDGVINSVLQETAESGIPIGVIPAGSGNDTARHFRIPTDPISAAEVIADGFVTTCDLGRVTDDRGNVEWFSSMLGCGQDAAASAQADAMKWARGRTKFTLAALAQIPRMRAPRYRITLEGARYLPFASEQAKQRCVAADGEIPDDRRLVINRQLFVATVGNTRCYGGGRVVCPQADHHDGMLDLTLCAKGSAPAFLKNFQDFIDGKHNHIPYITSYRAKRIRLECEEMKIPCYGDGEPLLPMPLTVEAVEAAGRYIIPAP